MRINPISPLVRNQPHKSNRAETAHWAYAYGSDAEYQAFCRKLRRSSYSQKTGDMEYCHYRTAQNSGIGCKPPFSGLPMTHTEHLMQHRVGTFHFMERERWEHLIAEHLKIWIESKACKSE